MSTTNESAITALREMYRTRNYASSNPQRRKALKATEAAIAALDEQEKEQAALEPYRVQAKAEYHDEGKVEVDDGAIVSKGDDKGAYVAAWVWVYDEDLPKSSEDAKALCPTLETP